MPDMKKLAELMKELETSLGICTRCGMCQAVCPLFSETGREADLARGKLALLDGLIQEMFKNPDGVVERLNRCVLCGSCESNCSSGVSVLEIFFKARAVISGFQGLSAAKKIIFRQMLARPEIFDLLISFAAKFQNLFARPVSRELGTSCARIISPLLTNRHFIPLASEPFHKKIPYMDSPPGKSGLRVGFFVGCLLDKMFPGIAEATIEVLQHHGSGIWIPENQGCCGIPAISEGDSTAFERLVRYNIDLFDDGNLDYLVTSCATCTFTIKKVWPMMLETASRELRAKMERLSQKTLDITQFLVSIIGVSASEEQKSGSIRKITYHDPCHLKKSLGIWAEPRVLINADSSSCLVEMHEADRCCGMGGSFNLHHYKLSSEIGGKKASSILDTGCQTVATACPACISQLSDALSKSGSEMRVKHVIEIYRDSIMKNGIHF
ncbi:MAG: (Fe-S)-binding protein [Deltaproteobacteria bacterium]|nr:(Fe-S)-binding protein [Deltaproteobacteria bacterium]